MSAGLILGLVAMLAQGFSQARLRQWVGRAVLTVALILHATVSETTVALLNCREALLSDSALRSLDASANMAGTSSGSNLHSVLLLKSDPFFVCFRGQHTAAASLAIVTLAFFVTVFPCVALWWVWRDPWLREQLQTATKEAEDAKKAAAHEDTIVPSSVLQAAGSQVPVDTRLTTQGTSDVSSIDAIAHDSSGSIASSLPIARVRSGSIASLSMAIARDRNGSITSLSTALSRDRATSVASIAAAVARGRSGSVTSLAAVMARGRSGSITSLQPFKNPIESGRSPFDPILSPFLDDCYTPRFWWWRHLDLGAMCVLGTYAACMSRPHIASPPAIATLQQCWRARCLVHLASKMSL